ncbi:MAG: ZIP family metal transporter [Treponema sp.]|jgi:ZIP family zinc transporter|nr:ZIP family metal transporter [Treponema sp.]
MIQIILFSGAAGILGMGVGGIISAILLKKPSDKIICWLLSFAAGVMVSIVCFGLVPETLKLTNSIVCLFGLILGIIVIMVLNRIIDRITETKVEKLMVHHTHEELYHESQMIKDPSQMLRSGILMLIAIALHNVPEGIAIGAGGSYNFRLGALLAIMIALHNIPEGMAIAAPLLVGGINRWKVILLTAMAGGTTLIGGLIGIALGNISELAVALSLSIAGGAMLYIVFGEIIPQSIVMTKNRTTSIVTLFGIIVGLIVTRL